MRRLQDLARQLSGLAIATLREFQRLNAFGSFPNQNLVVAFRSAAKRAGVTFPVWAVPYSLRHSFLTEVARGGADIRDIAQLGMHATLEQAARYVKGVADERATKAIQSVPRFSTTTKAAESPKRSRSVQPARRTKPPKRADNAGKK